MDESTRTMIAQAYDETMSEALAQGRSADVAHREGITAAAMFLSSLTGIEDAQALKAVDALGLGAQ